VGVIIGPQQPGVVTNVPAQEYWTLRREIIKEFKEALERASKYRFHREFCGLRRR
jgi:hypothetical protein